jgi:3-oxoacyl-[acyl-carrier-protein] synthase II
MDDVGLAGLAAASALGRGTEAQLAGALAGSSAFAPVQRFDVGGRRVRLAATLPDAGSLFDELATAIDDACRDAGLSEVDRSGSLLMLAVHGYPDAPRLPGRPAAAALAAELVERTGLGAVRRVYTSACVSASTAVSDAAALIRLGRAERIVVAAGYLVESDQFALFDAGRTLATDGAVRPFSTGRGGFLLGDAVAAVVVESVAVTGKRGGEVLARVVGWGRAGDAYHACQPHPEGLGMARAIGAALRRAGIEPAEIGYLNAHGAGTSFSDVAESAGLHRALGPAVADVPVSSTKSVHGHTLEASGLIELVITVLALRSGKLPVNVGYLGPDPECELNLILSAPRQLRSDYAVSVNAAFGGANTALVVRAA